MKLALIGYGNVGRAFGRLIERKRASFPFRIVGIHTLRHGTAIDPGGLAPEPVFGPPAASVDEFLDRTGAEVMIEVTPLNPATGEPAISHIRAAFARSMHVITANKGPIAHAYHNLRDEAAQAGVQFCFESTVMDGAPVFNLVNFALPGVEINGFTGVLNSTSKIVVEAMREGCSMEEGIERARQMGIAETDPSFDIDGWDSAAKTAALANVLLDARTTPQQVETKGIGRLTTARVCELAAEGKTVRLVSRAKRTPSGVRLRVRAEMLDETDLLASAHGTSNLLLFHTDLMGTVGTVSLDPTVEQTAYGLFSDLVNVARTV
ncbi:MAG: homoserine dehydrogenase [Acidobacteriales bacterium]|nr:homoserine dehydrogenase [Terriglobales bacterium]